MLHGSIVTNDMSRTFVDGTSRAYVDSDRAYFDPAPEEEEGGLRQFVEYAFGLVRRQYLIILAATVLAVAGSVVYLTVMPPTYKATVKVLLENPKTQFIQQQSVVATAPIDRAQLENQLEILKSKPIAAAVIKRLTLGDDPDLIGSTQFTSLLWARLQSMFGARESVAGVQSGQQEASDEEVAAFQDRLLTTQAGLSNVLLISYNSTNPQRAAEVANAIADTYLNDQMEAKLNASRTATIWLQKRLDELGRQALTSERAVNEFKLKNNLVAVGGTFMEDQRVTELNTRLVAARQQTSDALARLNRYETVLRAKSAGMVSSDPDLDAPVSDSLNNQIINSLRQQYLEYARRVSEWSTRYGPNHQAVTQLRTKMNDLRSSIASELRRLAETSRNDYEIARQREISISEQLANAVAQSQFTSTADLTMREMEMNAKNYRSLYDNFLQQYMRSIQQQSFPIGDARVISPASPPQGKSKPKSNLILMLGLAAGLAVGVGFGALRDIMDRKFRTPAQIKAALQTRCLALVPIVDRIETVRGQVAIHGTPARRTITRSLDSLWSGSTVPQSHFSESIRFIKLAVNQSSVSPPNQIIGITSALPNEGKSTIAAALGEHIAQAGGRVIVVDCDLRRPALSSILAPNAGAGLIEVLAGKRMLEETVWRDLKTDSQFLPAVVGSSFDHTGDILASEATRKLFDRLRATYDYVIVDLPPLTPIADVRATTPWIDGYILTVEWGRTNIDVVKHVLETAPDVHRALIGAVLNKADIKAVGRYDSSERHRNYGNYHSFAA